MSYELHNVWIESLASEVEAESEQKALLSENSILIVPRILWQGNLATIILK